MDALPDVATRLLRRAVREVASEPEACARDPARDFTRTKKISLEDLIWLMVTWERKTIAVELHRMYGWDGEAPSASAFCQQRAKLRDDVMPRVNEALLSRWPTPVFEGRFQLVAIDGTDVQLPSSGDPRTRVRSNQGSAAHNEAHPTTAYDVLRRTFEDMEWQGSKKQDEQLALCEIVDRWRPRESAAGVPLTPLFLADRNYSTYNDIYHLERAGASFILRARDDWVRTVVGADELPEGEFDVTVERVLVRTKSEAFRSRPDEPGIYRRIRSDTRLDAIPKGSTGEWVMRVRIIRRRIPARDGDPDQGDRWLNLVTNLTPLEMRAKKVVRTYKRRWSHEVGYMHLKDVVGMRDPRTRDYDRARMEVWGRLILFNACSLGTSRALNKTHKGRKRKRKPDLGIAYEAMLAKIRGAAADVAAVARRHTHVVIGGRHNERRKRSRSPAKLGHRP